MVDDQGVELVGIPAESRHQGRQRACPRRLTETFRLVPRLQSLGREGRGWCEDWNQEALELELTIRLKVGWSVHPRVGGVESLCRCRWCDDAGSSPRGRGRDFEFMPFHGPETMGSLDHSYIEQGSDRNLCLAGKPKDETGARASPEDCDILTDRGVQIVELDFPWQVDHQRAEPSTDLCHHKRASFPTGARLGRHARPQG